MQHASVDFIERLLIPMPALRELCEEYHVRRLSLFGSALRDDFNVTSDIDLLVEFLPDHTPGFFTLMKLQDALETFLARPVDLLTPKFIHERIRARIQEEARILYEATR